MKEEEYIKQKDLNNLVLEYQKLYKNKQNPKKVLEIILYYFNNYIEKYVKALKGIGYIDNEIITMYKLFGQTSVKEVKSIIKEVLRGYSINEIKHELIILFITRLQKFEYRATENQKVKSGTPMFPGYIKRYFPFIVKNWIAKLSKNPLNIIKKYSLFEDSGKENFDKDKYNSSTLQQEEFDTAINNLESDSVMNILVDNDFKKIRNILNSKELQVIQEYYINNYKIIKITEKFMISRKEFKTIINSAVYKLENYFSHRNML